MKQIKLLLNWMGNFWMLYVVHGILLIALTYSRTIVPQFVSHGIDSLLGEQDSVLPSFFSNIIDGQPTIRDQVIALIVLLVAFQGFRAVLMICSRFVYSIASENSVMRIRNKVYRHLQKLPFSYYKLNNTGDIIQRCSTDLDAIKTFLSDEVVHFVWITSMITTLVVQMLLINVAFTLISIVVFPIILVISLYYTKKLRVHFTKIDDYEGEMVNVITENVTGVQVVKAFGGQKFEFEKYDAKSEKYYTEIRLVMKYIANLHSSTAFLVTLQTLLIVVSGIYFVGNGQITVGTLILFITYIKILYYPVKMLASLITRMGRNIVAIDRINEIMEAKEETVEEGMPHINGNIEFCNVSFKYPDSNSYVLKDVSFKIRNGERVAIIGKTGSGKSTISHLLSRLFDVTSGTILVNGVDINTINKAHLRSNVGIVVQEPYLFSKPISENIAIKNSEYDMDAIINVAKIARIHNDISDFDKGYSTEVGERGTTLSGGQKQRLAIARMLINKHSVYVFDDSLSAVDNDTDKAIRTAIKKLERTTMINITHRITSILDCDHIIVLENGKVIEDGDVASLMKIENGYFKEMYQKQVGDLNE